MNYEAFLKKVSQLQTFGDDVHSPLQLHRWAKTGKILRLKRGLYTLPEERRAAPFSLLWLANTLYSPSYLSMEFVLSWYDLIPERVGTITSVTRLKTKTFGNKLGSFAYQHVKAELFFGFEPIRDEFQKQVLMATPEKALLDWLYLKKDWEPSVNHFEKNLRLQQLDQLKRGRLKSYLKCYSSRKMIRAGEILLEMF